MYQGNVESSYRTLFELKGEQLPSSYWVVTVSEEQLMKISLIYLINLNF